MSDKYTTSEPLEAALSDADDLLLADFAHLGAGQGGYNEDHEFYG